MWHGGMAVAFYEDAILKVTRELIYLECGCQDGFALKYYCENLLYSSSQYSARQRFGFAAYMRSLEVRP